MLLVQDHLSLICSQYLARALQSNNPSHSVVTSPSGSRNMKQTLQSRFLHCVAPHLSSGILPSTNYGTTIKFLHNRAVTISKFLLSHNRVLQTASPQITWKKQTFLGLTEIPFHNFGLISVAPSIPIVRG